jgi:hypothetical protein
MDVPPPLLVACALVSLLLLWASLHLRRRHRLLSDLPTSKTEGVFIGLVELKGTAESSAPLRSFLRSQACVHYAWNVQEQWSRLVTETYTDKDGKSQTRTRQESGWTTVAEGGESQPFYLRDDTGAILVRPDGARLKPARFFDETVSPGDPLYYGKGPAGAVADSDHRRRFLENGIALHADLYVVGQAREREDVVAPEIAADSHADLFLISTEPEEKVIRGYGLGSWVCWLLGMIAAGAAGLSLVMPPPGWLSQPAAAVGLGLLVFSMLWGLGWVWMVFNSLISLRQRVQQGWSLIDVQLQRRHDLIPNLVTAVAGLSSHEREVQTALAALRTQATATPPGVTGPDHAGLSGVIQAVAEKYPALTAQPEFGRLQRELVTTEQRIALARTYYNDLVMYYTTRLERIPDRWVGRLGSLQAPGLLQAGDFERAAVTVDFAQ